MARILALEAVAVAPTAFVLQVDPPLAAALLVGAACLGLGYLLLRLPGARPVDEGAWIGVAIGGGIGLAEAQRAVLLYADDLAWLRPWLLSIVACAGIGIALGFLARYELHHKMARAALRQAAGVGPHQVARLK